MVKALNDDEYDFFHDLPDYPTKIEL